MAAMVTEFNEGQGLSAPSSESQLQEMTAVVSRRLPSFLRIAFRRLGNMEDAEDAVQDALLSAYLHLDQFRGNAQMTTWLTSIVINSARLKVRRRSRRLHLSLDSREPTDNSPSLSEMLPDCRPDPETQYRQREFNERLHQWCGALPPALRTSLQLREMDGLSVSETAQALGITTSAVKNRASRARAQLRKFAACRPEAREHFARRPRKAALPAPLCMGPIRWSGHNKETEPAE